MNWAIFIAGALLAVIPFHFTLAVNGLSLLGVVIMLWGAGRIFYDDIRNGL